ATFDAKGKTLTAIDHVYAADLSDLRYQQVQQHGFAQQIDFRRSVAAKRVRIAVRDLVTDRIGTIDLPLEGAFTPPTPTLTTRPAQQ
ncbi:MAG: hypothetical protein ABI383_07210, partial [Acidobacteriaceae bacterium]